MHSPFHSAPEKPEKATKNNPSDGKRGSIEVEKKDSGKGQSDRHKDKGKPN